MATVYNLEPQPTAKTILHTTSGDIVLELFAQQTPLTSRNFLQLCIDGYYDNTIFHRLVPGFIVQGGDPTGTGSGGDSSYDGGKPFADEFHSRLKFNRRGLLGMANSGEKDDNGSQFFLTLGNTPELNGRNTMFGRVEAGNTIFNLVKMGEADLAEDEGSERPLYPTRITGTEVLVNPFEDMVKRSRVAERVTEDRRPAKKAVKRKATKALLSFGDEGDEEGPVIKTAKFNPKAVNGKEADVPPRTTSAPKVAPRKRTPSATPPRIASPALKAAPAQSVPPPDTRSRSPSPSVTPEPAEQVSKPDLLAEANAQIAALKNSLKRNVPAPLASSSKPKSALEAMIPITSTRGRKRKGVSTVALGGSATTEQQRALNEINAFRKRLEMAGARPGRSGQIQSNEEVEEVDGAQEEPEATNGQAKEADDDEAALCDLHFIANCQSCTKWDEKQDHGDNDKDDEDLGWMSHQLTFAKDRLGKSLEWKRQQDQELVVIDPREKEKAYKEERRGKRK